MEPEKFTPLPEHDAHREDHRVFDDAIRSCRKPAEDAVFGFRAAVPAPSWAAHAERFYGHFNVNA